MNVFEKMLAIDRRWIFLAIAVAVVVPFLFPMGLPVVVTPPVQQIYDAVDAIQPNSTPLLLSIDYAPSTMPELEPMTEALLRHAFSKDVNVIVMTLQPAGFGLAQDAVTRISREMIEEAVDEYEANAGVELTEAERDSLRGVLGPQEHKDWVFLGFQPGVSAVILQMGVNIRNVFPEDANQPPTPLSQIPMMDGVTNYDDIALAITLSGAAFAESWIYYANQPYDQAVAAGVTAVMATDFYPYLSSGSLTGLLGGMRGAAEYEVCIDRPDKGVQGMDSQSIIHILIIVLIFVGNIAYFGARRRKKLAELESA